MTATHRRGFWPLRLQTKYPRKSLIITTPVCEITSASLIYITELWPHALVALVGVSRHLMVSQAFRLMPVQWGSFLDF